MNIFRLIESKIRKLQANTLTLTSIERNGQTATYQYKLTGEWKKYFRSKSFAVDYGIDISTIPEGVLVIPFLANILPISWLCDAEIFVNEIESNFYDCINKFKNGYIKMYPTLSFKGKVSAQTVKTFTPLAQTTSAMFFSGGVDSFDTFLSHRNEKPLLITLWGSDVTFNDHTGWDAMLLRINYLQEKFNLDSVTIKTNFRKFLRARELDRLVQKNNVNWWYGFQHGIGIICHAAPIAYLKGFKSLYIASSNTEKTKGDDTCASDPTIDEAVCFLNTHVIHDGYEFDRLSKVKHIVDYARETNEYLPLHVCWETSGGGNCSHCEKCTRTILEIYACGENPKKFGFNPELISEKVMIKAKATPTIWYPYYPAVFEELKKRYTQTTIADWAKWIFKY